MRIVNAEVLAVYEGSSCSDIDISYTCPHCGETVEDSVSMSDASSGSYILEGQPCPECAEENNIAIDL